MAATAVTLYDTETALQAYVDTEAIVSEQDRLAFEVELKQALKVARDKRNSVIGFIRQCEATELAIDGEIKRLKARKERISSARERLEQFAHKVIEEVGYDSKGRYVKLEADLGTLQLRKCPDSVEITDENAVPERFKALVIEVPAHAWRLHLEMYNSLREAFATTDTPSPIPPARITTEIRKQETKVSKTDIAKAIKAGETVPGATLRIDKYELEVA